VEDDALVRGFVIVQPHGLSSTAAVAYGHAALESMEDGQPFELLFTDVAMPGGMTSRQLAVEANGRQPETKILCTSGYAEAQSSITDGSTRA
jgi:CheY-like chemotaxis protein